MVFLGGQLKGCLRHYALCPSRHIARNLCGWPVDPDLRDPQGTAIWYSHPQHYG